MEERTIIEPGSQEGWAKGRSGRSVLNSQTLMRLGGSLQRHVAAAHLVMAPVFEEDLCCDIIILGCPETSSVTFPREILGFL
ncbi:hypothetical protein RRG08_027870 [Elysia crispata]|uniref:Uncharacterized protein n=1 Tax=Elysia crispata TaxID=231223 RepID=A0AAE1A8Y0_9GAST|nr:hypothetical protein RRG08_027870 [Elysia crispata]